MKIILIVVSIIAVAAIVAAVIKRRSLQQPSDQTAPSTKGPSLTPSAEAMQGLRLKMLTMTPAELKIQPTDTFPKVYGVLMDWPLDQATVTIVSLSTGDASLYTTSTFGVLGGIGHASVRAAALDFVKAAGKHVADAAPTQDFPYPKAGRVRFYIVCFDGVRMIETDLDALTSGKDPCADLWASGQAVMTELRLIVQQPGQQ